MVPKVMLLRGIVSCQAQFGKLRGQLRAGVSERSAIKGGYLGRNVNNREEIRYLVDPGQNQVSANISISVRCAIIQTATFRLKMYFLGYTPY